MGALQAGRARRGACRAAKRRQPRREHVDAAAARALVLEEGLAAVLAWEAENGALSHGELTWADAVIDGECDSFSA